MGISLMTDIFHILENSDILKKLKEELFVAWPEMEQVPKYEELEKLPYLVWKGFFFLAPVFI